MPDAKIVIATGAKWGYIENAEFSIGIIDEAYQMRSDQLLYVADLFPRALMVGDPGQLDPFTPVDDTRWRGQPAGPVTPAVATVLHNHPQLNPHRLPVSWRLSAKCTPLVSEAFYPNMPFQAGTTIQQRSLTNGVTQPGLNVGGTDVDTAIETAIGSGWANLELPYRICPGVDAQVIDACARTALRALQRNLTAVDSPEESGPVAADKIAIGVAHRSQRSAIQVRLAELSKETGIDSTGITVDTANRIQGREYHIVIVLHPLSGRATASEFHLETGRLCVLLSRHRHACIVVSRAGIADVIDNHPMTQPVWIGAPLPIPDGWEANQHVLETLEPLTVQSHGRT